MNNSRRLVEVMAEVSDLLACLDLADLPAVHMITVKPHHGEPGQLDGSAMLRPIFGKELECIDAVRTWAVALDGVTALGDEIDPGTDYSHRRLSASTQLPSGGLFEVWVCLYDLHPAADQASANDLVSA